jgi:hypothetical protein
MEIIKVREIRETVLLRASIYTIISPQYYNDF